MAPQAASLERRPPSKISDPNYFDPSIVRINAKGIIERDKVWEAAAKLLAAANINEAEVDLLPKAPLAKGYRLKFVTPGPTATTQAKQFVDSLRSEKGADATWQHKIVTLPDSETKEHFFIGLDTSRLEAAKSQNLKVLLDIIKSKLPNQPIAKLNRETAIAKSWKSLAELRQQTSFEKIIWQTEATNAKLDKSEIEKQFADKMKQRD